MLSKAAHRNNGGLRMITLKTTTDDGLRNVIIFFELLNDIFKRPPSVMAQ